MALAFDLTSSFLNLPNLQPLTLRITGQADQAIAKAIDEPADWKDPDQAGGQVLEGDTIFVWPKIFTPIKPPLGALLIDADGTAWTILAVTGTDVVNTWDARCRNLAVAYGLNNVASVYKATYAKSVAGEAVATYAATIIGIPARFQPIDVTEQILEDAEWPKTTYHVILGIDIFAPGIPVEPASADYRLVDSAGRHFRIMKYTRAERIDALPIAECVLVIEGSEGGAEDRVSSSGA